MRTHYAWVCLTALLVVIAGCAPTADEPATTVSVEPPDSTEPTDAAEPTDTPEPTEASEASAAPTDLIATFPTNRFTDVSEKPVSNEVAKKLQSALNDMAADGGMAATVMSADGTWSGAAGKADLDRDVGVNDQFAIASSTKPIVAAQVMQLVEAGELGLDDPASGHLPSDLDFDTNGATIRQLLNQRSGLADYYPAVEPTLRNQPKRIWKPAELLELVPDYRTPAGESFAYGDTNYLLLGLVIEQVRGRPIAQVLRDGVLAVDGVERLIYQPAEKPTPPLAMPDGASTDELKKGGGYLPSLAGSTSDGPGAAMASDAPSLARWWRAFCAGEIVSHASLNEMTTAPLTGSTTNSDDYGLGLFNVSDPYAAGVGHTGQHVGYVSWAGCLPDDGLVVVVLANRVVEDIGGMARPLVAAAMHPDR